MAASSSASACALTDSSMPLACVSKRVDAAAVPNDELVEERADTALFTFFWLLVFVNYLGAVDRVAVGGCDLFFEV